MAHVLASRIGGFALLLGLVACGGSSESDGEKHESDETSKQPAARSNEPGTSAGVGTNPAEPEIVTDEVIRVEGGYAVLGLPPKSDAWEVVHGRSGDVRHVTLFRGTSTNYTGFITVVFLPPESASQTVAEAHARAAALLQPSLAGLSSIAEPELSDDAFANGWIGAANASVPERGWLGVTTVGPAAAGILVRGASSIVDSELMPMAKALIANVLLGTGVIHLPDTKPSVPLSGVWESKSGLKIDWITFDPRGYAHMNPPEDPSWLDVDVCFTIRRSLRTYRFEGDEIILEPHPADPSKTTYRWKFAQTGDSLEIAGMDHRRVDLAPVTLSPGTYEYYESSNDGGSFSSETLTYELAADGSYSYSDGFRFMHTEPSLAAPGETEWSASGFAGQVPATGKWRLDEHTLILDDGTHKSFRSIFASQHSAKIVYIDGVRFVKMK